MTTQIVIGNGYGLALATDSAVTVGDRRTYETSEKLIVVGEPHCIAVLVSGSVTQFSLPIQVLVSEWANAIKSLQLRKVVDYRESFISWLRDNMGEFPEPEARAIDAFWEVDSFFRACWGEINDIDPDMDSEERTQETLNYLEFLVNRHQQFHLIDHFQELGGESAALRILNELWEERKDWWPGLDARLNFWFDDIDPAALAKAKELARTIVLKRIGTWSIFGSQTEVAFAGYGAKEMIPSYASVLLLGGYRDWLSSFSLAPKSAQKVPGGYYLLQTLGQTDYIDNILHGYRTELIDSAAGVLEVAQKKHQDEAVNQEMGDPIDPPKGHDLKQQLRSAVEQGAEETMLRPLRRAVSAMPLKSLAEAARSLVGVQALGRAISGELQTTGGRIEVAVITRAGGVQFLADQYLSGSMDRIH